MFNNVFSKEGIDAAYVRIAASDAEQAVSVFRSLGIKGMNVTAPFKESIVKYLDKVHGAARILECVNTIVIKGNKLHGYNTDPFGVIESFADAGITLKGKRCLVVGAGGAGKAAAFGLNKEGAYVTIINRTDQRAKKAAEKTGCKYGRYSELKELVKKSEIIISTLIQKLNLIKKKWLKSSHIIFDANYKNSLLNKMALEKGCYVVSAENWLLNQAIKSYEIFLGEKPDKNLMEEGLSVNGLSGKKNSISLIGLAGAGKSSTGKVLSKKLKYEFIDTDDSISAKKELTVGNIFKNHGEKYFRDLETEELEESLNAASDKVISCGGGIILRRPNREILKEKSIVVWLHSSPEVVYSRIDISKRPLLQTEKPMERLKELLSERKGMYAKTADIIFCSEKKSKKYISKKIIKELNSL